MNTGELAVTLDTVSRNADSQTRRSLALDRSEVLRD